MNEYEGVHGGYGCGVRNTGNWGCIRHGSLECLVYKKNKTNHLSFGTC